MKLFNILFNIVLIAVFITISSCSLEPTSTTPINTKPPLARRFDIEEILTISPEHEVICDGKKLVIPGTEPGETRKLHLIAIGRRNAEQFKGMNAREILKFYRKCF